MTERRKTFFVNKPFQLRYMAYVSLTLFFVSAIIVASLYFGIWGSIIQSFSDERIREDLLTASRMTQYEDARTPGIAHENDSLSTFKSAEKLSARQREIFKEILDQTNRDMIKKLLFVLAVIAWGSIYLTHKIAGPLHRFQMSLKTLNTGDFRSRVHLRRSDEALFLARDFNETIEHLDIVFSRLKNVVRANQDDLPRMKLRLEEELDKIKTSVDK